MSKRYIFLVFILVSIIFALLLLPKVHLCANDVAAKLHLKANTCQNVSPKGLLLEAINTHRYIDVDKLTSKIVGEDPSYVLVDLREVEQYSSFTLPRAVNIPYKKVLDEEFQSFFESDDYTFVLFSNGTIIADQVWSILRRKGYSNLMVLEGGLNEFYEKILNPTKPIETDSKEADDLYSFRKAAGAYFGLPNPDEFIPKQTPEPLQRKNKFNKLVVKNKNKKKLIVKPKIVKEEEEDEGC